MHFSAIFLPLLFGAGHVCAIQIATWNVRYDSKTDAIPVAESKVKTQLQGERGSEQPWSTRRIGIANYLTTHKVSVLGVQEALIRQVKDLQELFGTDWAWVGEGRDDGKEKGEYCAIFYNKKDVTLSSNETFWLSQTPLEPSKYTGAGSPRLATVAKFTTVDGKPFSVINTHLDDQSNEQRMVGASMLRIRAKFEAYNGGANDGKVFILGDFNSQQDGEDSGAYKIATGSQDVNLNGVAPTWVEAYKVPEGQLNEFKMLDLRSETPRGSVSGPEETFTGFSAEQKPQASKKVDFILGGSNKGWEAKTYTVGQVLNDDGVLLSDHRPVIVEVGL